MPPEPQQSQVLLVEDDDVDAMAVQRGLRKLGCAHRIHRERDGEKALEYLRAAPLHRMPVVLLVDINMPRMNGIDFIAELRSDRGFDRVEIFVITTSKLTDDLAAARRLDVAGYFTKDEADEAYRLVVEALRRAGAEARAQP